MKNILYILIGLTLVSCVKDDTVNDFETLGEVEINGLQEAYQFNYLEEATVEPQVVLNGLDEENVEYRWYMYTPTSRFLADTISREKNINTIISASPGGDYTLVFSVRDLNTGIFYKKQMTAEVLVELTKGIMVLAETGGSIDVNFIRPDSTVIYNVFANANPGESIGTMPNKIQFVNPNTFGPALKNVYVFSNDVYGGVLLSPITFKIEKKFSDAFYVRPNGTTLNTELYYRDFQSDFLLVNGKMHNRSQNSKDPLFKTELLILDADVATDYSLAPFFFNTWSITQTEHIVHDNLHGRLLVHKPYNKSELHQFTGGDITAFDYNNTGVKMLYGGRANSVTGISGICYFGIGEGPNDPSKRYLMRFVIRSVSGNLEPYTVEFSEFNPSDFPGLHASTMFVATSLTSTIRGILWYSDGKKLYALSTDQDGARSEVVVRDFEAEGMVIDALKIDGRDVLQLAVRDLNLSTGGAGLIYMKGGTTGGINAVETYNSFGIGANLGDRIIDFDEKLN